MRYRDMSKHIEDTYVIEISGISDYRHAGHRVS
ncbi:MAG: hypothetical protein ACJAUU_001055 [Rickettsiales bacterium]|jgi:hypothetical protein